MKLKELIKNIEVLSTNAAPDTEISGISYDSRLTRPGDLFVAIKGFETDGHRYIPKAMEKGAAAVLCEDIPADGTPYVQTADCRFGLAMASREFFGNPASEMKMIGFTGTSGKTSSTYIMKHLLEAELDAKVGLIGTNGNMIGDEFLHSEHTTPESYELHKLFREMADAGCTQGHLQLGDDINHEVVGNVPHAFGGVDFNHHPDRVSEIQGGGHTEGEFHIAVFAGHTVQKARTHLVKVGEVLRDKVFRPVGENHCAAVVPVQPEVTVQLDEPSWLQMVFSADVQRQLGVVHLVVGVDVNLRADFKILGDGPHDVGGEQHVGIEVGTETNARAELGSPVAFGAEGVVHVPDGVQRKSACGEQGQYECGEYGEAFHGAKFKIIQWNY